MSLVNALRRTVQWLMGQGHDQRPVRRGRSDERKQDGRPLKRRNGRDNKGKKGKHGKSAGKPDMGSVG